MKTVEEVLVTLERRIDRSTLEDFVARDWVRPHRQDEGWQFEEIDIARLELVCHLAQDIEVNEAGIDVALSLLDQVYGLRAHLRNFADAIAQQPPEVQAAIMAITKQRAEVRID